jgi:hypothetical protein
MPSGNPAWSLPSIFSRPFCSIAPALMHCFLGRDNRRQEIHRIRSLSALPMNFRTSGLVKINERANIATKAAFVGGQLSRGKKNS